MKENELKPCPFCGGRGHKKQIADFYVWWKIIRCGRCKVQTRGHSEWEKAIQSWNKRSGDDYVDRA